MTARAHVDYKVALNGSKTQKTKQRKASLFALVFTRRRIIESAKISRIANGFEGRVGSSFCWFGFVLL